MRVSILPFDTLPQRTGVNANAPCGQVVTVFAFLAERCVFLAGLETPEVGTGAVRVVGSLRGEGRTRDQGKAETLKPET